jgi:hypothetical protein
LPALAVQGFGGGLHAFLVAADQHDGGAEAGVGGGDLQAEPGAAASDEGDAALERVVGEHAAFSVYLKLSPYRNPCASRPHALAGWRRSLCGARQRRRARPAPCGAVPECLQ